MASFEAGVNMSLGNDNHIETVGLMAHCSNNMNCKDRLQDTV